MSEMQRDAKGLWLKGEKPPTAIQTSERGRELATRRWSKAAQEARKALVEAWNEGMQNPVNTPTEAWGRLVGEVTKGVTTVAVDKPHDAARALAFVGKATEMLRPQEHGQQVAAVQVIVTAGRQLDAIEAEWTAVTSEDDDAAER